MYSFGEEKEFNMFPAPRLSRMKNHKYEKNGFSILKMASIYGANGAGKSSLIKSLAYLQDIVIEEKIPERFSLKKFKFNDIENTPQTLVVEYFEQNIPYIYGLQIHKETIITEELYESGLGKSEDVLLFKRTTNEQTKEINLTSTLLDSVEGKVLKKVIEKNLAKFNKPIFKLLTTLDESKLDKLKKPLNWFDSTLNIISPNAKPEGLAYRISDDDEFRSYVEDTMKTFHIGISDIYSEKMKLRDYFGKNNNEIVEGIENKFDEIAEGEGDFGFSAKSVDGKDELLFKKENNEIFVMKLRIEHTGKNELKMKFDLGEESDGTIRLLDFTPAFQKVICTEKVFIIDEIERSIHPLLIKELIKKFSNDDNTCGQIIFTTHESNLLDQEIFRQDEIWFAEKNKNGSTDLYTLSDFKEHNTIDIRKGYLSGRYGSIPFLGNLRDLNWHDYDIKK